MSFVPIGTSADTTIDKWGTEGTPPTPRMQGLALDMIDTFQHGGLGFMGRNIAKYYAENYDPGRFLNSEEIKNKYPNVSFPKGEYENVVKLISERKSRDDFSEQVIANLPGDFFTKTGRLGQMVLITGADMSGMVLAAGIGAVASESALALEATGIAAPIVIRSLVGALEGVAQVAPYVGIEYEQKKEIQEKVDPLNVAFQFGVGGLTLGLTRTIFGYKPLLNPKTARGAVNAAISQVENGKNPDVDLILKDARYKVVKGEALSIDEINALRNNFDEDITKVTERIDEEKINVEKELDKFEDKELYRTANEYESFNEFKENIEGEEVPKKNGKIIKGKLYPFEDLKNIYEESKKIHKKLSTLEFAKRDMGTVLEHTDSYIELLENNEEPVKPEQLQAKIKHLNSWLSDNSTYIDEYLQTEREAMEKPIPLDEEIKGHEQDIEDLRQAGKLTEEDEGLLEKLKSSLEKGKTLNKILKNTYRCIMGESE